MEEVGKTLSRVFERRAAKPGAALLEFLAPLWPRVTGPAVAMHSRPIAFTGGTLTVAASSASWAVALRQMSEELRAAVNGFLGRAAVRKLRIVVSTRLGTAEAGVTTGAFYEVTDETVGRLERKLARGSGFPKG